MVNKTNNLQLGPEGGIIAASANKDLSDTLKELGDSAQLPVVGSDEWFKANPDMAERLAGDRRAHVGIEAVTHVAELQQ